jgi:hypothetical protein
MTKISIAAEKRIRKVFTLSFFKNFLEEVGLFFI